MRVNILVTVPSPELFDSCTLCFDTLRVGFPTAEISTYINEITPQELQLKVQRKAAKVGGWMLGRKYHHAEWIRDVLKNHRPADGPCVILDSDTIFWKSCEDWQFDTPFAGFYNPLMWYDFAKCVSFERLHTSFLWVSDVDALFQKLHASYPNFYYGQHRDYCPVEPFMPRVQFIKGVPFFWDSCAALYNMIGGTHFSEEHFSCYEHLNSAAFYEVMHERLENKEGFQLLHKELVKTPEQLRGLWNCVHPYYQQKHEEALRYLSSAENFGSEALRTLKLTLR